MENEVVYLYLDDIIPNRFQPRELFDENSLKELAISIKEHGVIQPIIVRKVNNKYEIIAGERRYKASTMAGLTKIPAIIKNLDDKESSKVALIENLQRRDLTPIEEARTYQKILELEGNMTQEQLAATMGKTQSVVSNKLRLLSLPDEVQEALLKEQISERHARSLLNVQNKNEQLKLLEKVIASRMTVRELDKEIKMINEQGGFPFVDNSINDVVVNKEEDIKPTYQSAYTSLELSPTEVDINKIKENAIDIVKPEDKPTPAPGLMSMINNSNNNTPDLGVFDTLNKNNESNDDNTGGGSITSILSNPVSLDEPKPLDDIKPLEPNPSLFGGIPSFDPQNVKDIQEPVSAPQSLNQNKFLDFGTSAMQNANVNVDSQPATANMPMSFNSFITAEAPKKDVKRAKEQIMNSVKEIESLGFSIDTDELDLGETYQIVIKISKDL